MKQICLYVNIIKKYVSVLVVYQTVMYLTLVGATSDKLICKHYIINDNILTAAWPAVFKNKITVCLNTQRVEITQSCLLLSIQDSRELLIVLFINVETETES